MWRRFYHVAVKVKNDSNPIPPVANPRWSPDPGRA